MYMQLICMQVYYIKEGLYMLLKYKTSIINLICMCYGNKSWTSINTKRKGETHTYIHINNTHTNIQCKHT